MGPELPQKLEASRSERCEGFSPNTVFVFRH